MATNEIKMGINLGLPLNSKTPFGSDTKGGLL